MSTTVQEYKRSEVRAGIVILISMVLFCMVLMSVGKFQNLFAKKHRIETIFADVQGLKIDDPVQIMGLQRGSVIAIETTKFKPPGEDEAYPRVKVVAQFQYDGELTEDTKISIEKSLTGNTALKVVPGIGIAARKNVAFLGVDAVPLAELANKGGQMAHKIEKFLNDLTDNNVAGSIRASMINVKRITDDIGLVASSLSKSIPASEKAIISSVTNLSEIVGSLRDVIAKNKENISATLENVHQTSTNVSKTTGDISQIVVRQRPHIEGIISNLNKASTHIKTATREVRWQPWVLLNKPDEYEIRERSLYNSALEMSEGAETLGIAVRELSSLKEIEKNSDSDKQRLAGAMHEVTKNLEKLKTAQEALWGALDQQQKKSK